MELADLFPLFPSIDDPDFQSIIASKREFQELETESREDIPRLRGELFRHQKIIQRIMSEVDEMAIFHEPGTGKTCTVISVAEYFHQLQNLSYIKGAIILAFSDKLLNEIKFQIICRCTNGMYETDKIKSKQGSKLQSEITRLLKKEWYNISTYTTFTRQIWRRYWRPTADGGSEPNIEALRDVYSGYVFWFDEVQDIRLRPEQTIESIQMPSLKIEDDKLRWNKTHTYKVLWTLFHVTERRKVVLTTGTPMVNFPYDAISLFNLIIPADKQFPSSYNFETASLEDIRDHVGGRISYIRSMDTGIKIEYDGEELEGTYTLEDEDGDEVEYEYQTVVYPTEMSEHQQKGYLKASKELNINEESDDDDESSGVQYSIHLNNSIQACDVVYQDGTFGRQGVDNNIFKTKDGAKVAGDDLKEYISDIDTLKEISCKYGDIIERALETDENFFVFTEFKEVSGVEFLALCLQAHGYIEFRSGESVFEGGKSSFCGADYSRKIKDNFKKMKRYAVITGDTTQSNQQTLQELQRSPQNMHGEYLQFIIVSRIGRQGLSFSNVLNIEIIDPAWNPAMIEQAKMRCIRATSHNDLIRERRSQGITTPLTVTIRLHVANAGNFETINYTMYKRSEKKDRVIRRVMRKLKQIAFDCPLHRKRNIRSNPPEEDGSRECDYTTCTYKCMETDELEINTDTYDVYYLGSFLDDLLDRIGKILIYRGGIRLGDLYVQLKTTKKYVDLAIERGIVNKRSFVDRFGFTRYLHEDQGMIFLADSLYERVTYSTSYYTTNLSVVETISPESVARSAIMTIDQPDTETFVTTGKVDQDIPRVERAIIKYRDIGTRDPILNTYNNFWFELPYPGKEIEKRILDTRGDLKTKNAINAFPASVLERVGLSDGPKVYIHNLENLITLLDAATNFNLIVGFRRGGDKIRILDRNGFRDTNNDVELYYLNAYVQKFIYDRLKPYEDQHVYQFTLADKKFIRNNLHDPVEVEGVKTDGRMKHRGRGCMNWGPAEFFQVAWDSKIDPPPSSSMDYHRREYEKLSGEVLDRKLGKLAEDDMSDEQKRFVLLWQSIKGKKVRCAYFDQVLQERGLNFIIYQ